MAECQAVVALQFSLLNLLQFVEKSTLQNKTQTHTQTNTTTILYSLWDSAQQGITSCCTQ